MLGEWRDLRNVKHERTLHPTFLRFLCQNKMVHTYIWLLIIAVVIYLMRAMLLCMFSLICILARRHSTFCTHYSPRCRVHAGESSCRIQHACITYTNSTFLPIVMGGRLHNLGAPNSIRCSYLFHILIVLLRCVSVIHKSCRSDTSPLAVDD